MADLQPHVPQAIEDGFGDLLAPGGLLVGQDEQQIDIGLGCHQPAAIAAGGDHGHALGAGGNMRAIKVPGCGGVEDADDLVLDETQPLRAVPAVPVLQQHGLGGGARRDHFGLEQLRHRRAKHVLAAGVLFGKRVDRGGDPRGIEPFVGLRAGLGHGAVHDLPRYRTPLALSLLIVGQQ